MLFRSGYGGAATPAARRRGRETAPADGPCTVCGFRTLPPHDARTHRYQGKKKAAFTNADLHEKGLTKV